MIAENVRKLLLSLLKDEVIVASWGISNIIISETQLSFSVSGFKYQGGVTIEVKNGINCEVFLDKVKLGCFTFDKVVKVIDEKVENSVSCYHSFFNQLRNNHQTDNMDHNTIEELLESM